MKNPFTSPWRYFSGLITHYEKIILAALAVVIIISGTVWFNEYSRANSGVPLDGGTYIEGIVGNQSDAQAVASKMTNTGLFTFDTKGNLQNQLVSSWTKTPDNLDYTFTLKNGVDPSDIKNSLLQNIDLIGEAEVTSSGQNVEVKLAATDPNLPLTLTQPIFDYGPYQVNLMSGQEIILVRNTRKGAVRPYINKIIIRTFSSQSDLETAVKKNKVDGALLTDSSFTTKKFNLVTVETPNYYAVIFNTNRDPFRDLNYRQSVVTGKSGLANPFTLTVANKQPDLTLANNLIAQWQKEGIPATLSVVSAQSIDQTIAPSRNFQALLTGISYDTDLDPYYIWNSTQIRPPGNNLAGLKDGNVDTLITQIEQTNSVPTRENLITQLHQIVSSGDGAAIFVQQQSVSFLVSKNIAFVPPAIALSAQDKWQMLADWWVK